MIRSFRESATTNDVFHVAKQRRQNDSQDAAAGGQTPLNFEDAQQRLEEIVRLLEEGQLPLADSLARYEEGVRLLRQCHGLLQQAERKIELLAGVDAQGNAVTEPYDDAALSLDEKAAGRAKRRSQGKRPRPDPAGPPHDDQDDGEDDMDAPGRLF